MLEINLSHRRIGFILRFINFADDLFLESLRKFQNHSQTYPQFYYTSSINKIYKNIGELANMILWLWIFFNHSQFTQLLFIIVLTILIFFYNFKK